MYSLNVSALQNVQCCIDGGTRVQTNEKCESASHVRMFSLSQSKHVLKMNTRRPADGKKHYEREIRCRLQNGSLERPRPARLLTVYISVPKQISAQNRAKNTPLESFRIDLFS